MPSSIRTVILAFFSAILCTTASVAQTAVVAPTTVSFGNLAVNTTSTPKTVTLTNTSALALNIASITANGDFAQTNNCPAALAKNTKCSILVTFTPTLLGARTGSLVITDNAGSGTQTVVLKGSGIAQVYLSATNLYFGSIVVGVPSSSKAITLANNLSVPLSISSVVSSSADFSVQSGCGSQVPAKANCSLAVTFTPSAVGARNSQFTIIDSASPSTQIVKLSGTGLAVKLQSISVLPSAGSIPLGSPRQFQALGLYNNNTTQDLTASAVWTSSATSVATISNAAGSKGLLNPVMPGSTTISAKVATGSTSVTGLTTATVVSVLTSITVTPAAATVIAGTAQQFTATGNYNDGTQQNLTALVAWASSNPTVASIGGSGLAATASAGMTTITATQGALVGAAQLTVQPVTLTAISVMPGLLFVGVGSNRQYTAMGMFNDGSTKDLTRSVIWATSDPTIATVDSYGLGTSTGAGAATITATAGTISGSTTLSGVANGFVSCDVHVYDMRVLVVTNGASEADLPAITQSLDQLGTPYTVFDMSVSGAAFTPAYLANGCHGLYQGVIFTFAGNRYGIPTIGVLDQYERDFQVRHLNWFAYPDPNFGLSANPTVASVPYPASYTAAAAAVFPYANPANPLTINFATVYLSTAVNGATPLLTDTSGNALAVTYNAPYAYQQLTLTFDSNPDLTHDLVLSHGLINWVTQGLFLGEHHAYLTPQVDDYFIEDSDWLVNTACGTNPDATGFTYRMNAADVTALVNWQTGVQSNPLTSNFVLSMAFNGFGAQPGSYNPDDLTPASQANQGSFRWINHTFDHTNLNAVTYAVANSEISQNNTTAATLGFTSFDIRNMVTPDISGLTNPNFLQAAFDNGVRYLVTDTSIPGYQNPTPNTGIPNPFQPSILMLPRHPNNLFYNVSTPDGWTAEYGCIYPQLAYSYPQILDNISDSFVANMLKGDIDPEMFHQPNLRAYDGTHSILGDLVDATTTKYGNLVTFPIQSLAEDVIGAKMAARAQYNAAGVTASFIPHQRVMITAAQAATVPFTGVPSATAETYGSETISHVDVAAGQTVTLPLP